VQSTNVKGIYIHIPFCNKICSYCDFCKNFYNEKIVNEYIKSLSKEVKCNYKNECVSTIYIGGGTPSSLSNDMLDKLFFITNKINLDKDYEFTFECNYEDITEELLIKLKNNKVNRLSIGLQTFNKKFESILERTIDKEKMINNVFLAKKYFNNINVDLMYAIPGESKEDLLSDINEFLELGVAHVSTYALIFEEHTKLNLRKLEEINEDLQNEMYYLIINMLKEKGYKHYEISNFSKENYESKHNLMYWNNNRYYGFGAGASGFIKNVRYDNTKSIFKYIKENNKNEEELDQKELMNDEIMLNLRKIDGINKKMFLEKYNKEVKEVFNYKELLVDGLIIETDENIFINEKYLFVSNEIIIRFVESCILK